MVSFFPQYTGQALPDRRLELNKRTMHKNGLREGGGEVGGGKRNPLGQTDKPNETQ